MNKRRIFISIAICIAFVLTFACTCYASSPTDEILSYVVKADLNQDGTVNLNYSIDWKVLESDDIGPLSDVYIGIPNSDFLDFASLSDNIMHIEYDYSYGCMHIFFYDEYYEGDIVSFSFSVVQDYMYEMNAFEDGYTLYYFVPGWFDNIDIDYLAIYWNTENTAYFSSKAKIVDGYLLWETSVPAGESFQVEISYPNDCGYFFDDYKSFNNYQPPEHYNSGINFEPFIAVFWFVAVFFIICIKLIVNGAAYDSNSGFASGQTKTKVTHTKIEYYPNCPGCGSQRKEGQTTCEYCGRSLIKSEEIIKEDTASEEDKDAFRYKKAGEYHFGPSANTYVRVNVVHVPVSGGSSSRGSSGSSGRSSCAHSSCACACAGCACACACACAGGGRAGCSNKDFYNTNLKLKQLELKK